MGLNKIVGIDMDGGSVVDGEVSVNRIASGVEKFLGDKRDVDVVLYGCSEKIVNAFGKRGVPAGVEIVPSSVFYKDKPLAKYLRGTSLSNLVKDVRGGNIEGIFSIGDTAKFGVESVRMRVDGIGMPTFVTTFPSLKGDFVCSDGGFTNARSKEKFYINAVSRWAGDIYEQALMASVYAEGLIEGRLRWGILSNGTEGHKGSDVDDCLDGLIKEGIREKGLGDFVTHLGKIEPSDCYDGNVDVALVGGYVGNMFLKTSEGTSGVLGKLVQREFDKLSFWDKAWLFPGRKVLRKVKNNLIDGIGMDARSNALVLGYRAPVIKGHGTARVNAIYHGIRRLADCDESFSGERILARVGKYFLDSE